MPTKPINAKPMDPSRRHGRGLLLTVSVVALGAGLALTTPPAIAEPPPAAIDAISARYDEAGGAQSPLGTPTGGAVEIPGGVLQDYNGGAIYYSADTGAKIMYGEILKKYRALGGPGEIGFPSNDESDTGDGAGKFNNFSEAGGAAIYWSPVSGAWLLKGKVLDAWRASADIRGPFGYPTADTTVANGVDSASFGGPEGTQIQWSPSGGLATVPPALAASIPGFSASAPTAEGTASVSIPAPTVGAPSVSTPSVDTSSNNNWLWWLLVPLGLALLGGLLWLLNRGRRTVPAANLQSPDLVRPNVAAPNVNAHDLRVPGAGLQGARAPEVRAPDRNARVRTPDAPARFTAPTPPPPPVAPPRVKPATVPPEPRVESRPPKIETPAAPQARQMLGKPIEVEVGETPPLEIKYEGSGTGGDVEVTYENNAIGANQWSHDDKSDLDHQPGRKQAGVHPDNPRR